MDGHNVYEKNTQDGDAERACTFLAGAMRAHEEDPGLLFAWAALHTLHVVRCHFTERDERDGWMGRKDKPPPPPNTHHKTKDDYHQCIIVLAFRYTGRKLELLTV